MPKTRWISRLPKRLPSPLGHLDVGQGAVAVGGRVVALEGPEGTDAMLERVARLKADGRISSRRRGVLVKLCKPQQDLRADLPSIGPSTIKGAQAAGLAGIAVESGRALVLDREEMIALANEAGLFVTGVDRALFARWTMSAQDLKLAVIAGEVSGDLLGADLVKALRPLVMGKLSLVGVGGEGTGGRGPDVAV